MENIETITLKLQQLSDEKLREVAAFIDSLLAPDDDVAAFERALDETAGIWRDEPDGIAYTDKMRSQWAHRGRQQW